MQFQIAYQSHATDSEYLDIFKCPNIKKQQWPVWHFCDIPECQANLTDCIYTYITATRTLKLKKQQANKFQSILFIYLFICLLYKITLFTPLTLQYSIYNKLFTSLQYKKKTYNEINMYHWLGL